MTASTASRPAPSAICFFANAAAAKPISMTYTRPNSIKKLICFSFPEYPAESIAP